MLRGGRAESGRVVAPGWVRAATVDRSGYFGYGLGWWVEAGSRGGQRPFLARGKYGQVVDWKTTALDVATRVNR